MATKGPNRARSDSAVAAEMATAAGELLLSVRKRGGDAEFLKAWSDEASHRFLVSQLAVRFAGDAVLSEEAPDESDRLTNPRVWIIDPLDGTREFSEPPRDDWAVHVALVEDGELVAGAVALPGMRLTLSSEEPVLQEPAVDRAPRILVSRTRPSEHSNTLRRRMKGELMPMGSAGAKAMAVARGDADIYVHSGGQWEWDSAAPVAVAAACGMHVSRLDGSKLRYNQPNPWLPDILICRPEFAQAVIETCRS